MRHPFMSCASDDHLARQVAQAAGSFEHLLLGRTPRSVMVVKKLGEELVEEYRAVVKYLGEVEGLRVVVRFLPFFILINHR